MKMLSPGANVRTSIFSLLLGTRAVTVQAWTHRAVISTASLV